MVLKNNLTKRFFLLLLSIMLILSGTATVDAAVKEENEISPCYTYISNKAISFYISGIKAHCTATIHASQSVKLTIKMELQKKKSSGYETVETWTDSKTGTSLALSESRIINIFSDYRLKVTYTAGSETEISYKY